MAQLEPETKRLDYHTSTPLIDIDPDHIRVQSTTCGVMKFYQKRMSKATWRPAFGRKLSFLVTQDEHLLGLIFLATPVIRLTARDKYLFPQSYQDAHPDLRVKGKVKTGLFDYGRATKNYMDLSVCVSAQPVGWHWNLGKLMALIAPTLGDYVKKAEYETLMGVTTTSLWGKGTQYNRIYKFLGFSEGFGSVMVSDDKLAEMIARARARCSNCTPGCKNPLPLIPKYPVVDGRVRKEPSLLLPETEWCVVPYCRFGDGCNPRMRRIATMWNYFPEEKPANGFFHGKLKGVYYHPAISASCRLDVIQNWYKRWGLPRYIRTKNQKPPYQTGLEGKPE